MNREVHVRFSEGLALKYAGLLDTAIPELLEVLDIAGCIVTIDAMGTQTKIARTIRERGGHYVLCVKDNHPKLRDSIMFADIDTRDPLTPSSTHESTTARAPATAGSRCAAVPRMTRLIGSTRPKPGRMWPALPSSRACERWVSGPAPSARTTSAACPPMRSGLRWRSEVTGKARTVCTGVLMVCRRSTEWKFDENGRTVLKLHGR